MTTYLVSFLLAFAVSVLLTPALILGARRWGLVDRSAASHRKIHAGEIPRLGGVAIVAGFYAPILGLWVYETKVGDALLSDGPLALGLLGGGTVIAALGLMDDLRDASPRVKLLVQVGVAVALVALGFRIERLDLPLLPQVQLGYLGWPLTVLWIVGITNAVNLIDGLDGLAGGMALFGIAPVAVLALSNGNLLLALISCALAGAVLGFLVFNFHPARIFMGDTGSMFLGFVLAVATVETSHKGRVAVAMLTPILALGLPILDTFLAIARRAWFGQSLFVGDKQHIHHRLLASGLSHRNTVLVMYSFAAVFAGLGLAVGFNRNADSTLLFAISLVVAGVLLRKVGYLALPGAAGTELSVAIRERNKLVRDLAPRLSDALSEEARIEEVAAAAAAVAWSAGARTARLELAGLDPAAPTRVWTWAESDAQDEVEQCFHLQPQGGPSLGTLTLSWAAPAFHEAVLPPIEQGLQGLTRRLARHRAAAQERSAS
jgi:UDP-GlcNAc:undecaprenyl-phosphate GlcNAc-1-phosphate transferase